MFLMCVCAWMPEAFNIPIYTMHMCCCMRDIVQVECDLFLFLPSPKITKTNRISSVFLLGSLRPHPTVRQYGLQKASSVMWVRLLLAGQAAWLS
jgi:hypothetical protein